MKRILLIVFLFAGLSAFSQAIIQFDSKVHDFGKIKEVDGAVSYHFEFVNQGKTPILIKNVESSCGCTSPEWTKQPILPGKKGFVKAIFDPKDRPGFFDKTITVFSNAQTSVVELKIRGTVEGKTRTVLDDYPYELPSGLRLPIEELSLMKARKGEVKTVQIEVFNNAGKQVAVNFTELPAYIQLSVEPKQIANKAKAVIKATYHTELFGEYGLNKENVVLVVDGKKYDLPVSVYIEEDFGKVNLATAPMAEVDKKYYHFGQIASTESASFVYQLKNIGKDLLKIRRVYTNDERIKVDVTKQELQPGESVPVTVKTITNAEKGKVTAVVSVITNSPTTSEVKLRFYGEIH